MHLKSVLLVAIGMLASLEASAQVLIQNTTYPSGTTTVASASGINANTNVTVPSGATVIFSSASGTQIVLGPGFHATAGLGSSFHALIDTQAPSAPSNLVGSGQSTSVIALTWNAATDNVAVAGYLIYRNGQQVGTSSSLAFFDSGLIAGTTYTYTVRAYDAAGNVSADSGSAQATTLLDPNADNDSDGIPNGIESLLGTNPSSANSSDTSNQNQLNIHRPTP